MMDMRAALSEKFFQLLHLNRRDRIEDSESESLRQRRSYSVEHRVCPRHFNPFRAAFREESGSGFDEFRVAARLGAFKAARKSKIGKYNWVLTYDHRISSSSLSAKYRIWLG